jgi:membrane-associated protein
MDIITLFFDIILHIDKHLATVIDYFGPWSYIILFMVLFIETGVVIAPYLPGDSLIFAIGTFTAVGAFSFPLIFITLTVAAILGDSLNYAIGNYVGPKVFRKNYRWLDMKALLRTQEFFDKHGGKTIILARFVPILRTFAPFLAGVGTMKYKRFLTYNVVGAILWVGIFLTAGFLFGNIPIVKDNFSVVILAIIFVSLIPVIIEFAKYCRDIAEQNKRDRNKQKSLKKDSPKKKFKTMH